MTILFIFSLTFFTSVGVFWIFYITDLVTSNEHEKRQDKKDLTSFSEWD